MADSSNSLTAATAWVASLGVHAPPAAEAVWSRGPALDVLRNAQVALYCDHEHEAILALRQARRLLADGDRQGLQARRAVDEAAWHIRHHETRAAQSALQNARDRLG